MTDERDERVAELFERALDLPDGQRPNFLDQQCGSDQGLRERVETLLRHDEAVETRFLAGRTESSLPLESAGAHIGPYTLRERIGEGGLGEVYLAEQTEPVRRQVALKLIKPGMDTRQVVARFEAERQALAVMDHPHITKVFDAGATERGRPYFVMEYVPGAVITKYCDAQRLDTAERVRLLIEVCDAVQHAHYKGIIHRDLKPSNILVELADGRPIPKIIDFGVAKATGPRLAERMLLTETGALIGTPGYMSPEQADMTGTGVDLRTDIYSLGVILYEVLAGLPPFDSDTFRGHGLGEIQRIIREVEPPTPSTRLSVFKCKPSPSANAEVAEIRNGRIAALCSVEEIAERRRCDPRTLRRRLQDDLDWITMKAMEKDRARRYSSASELAADLRHHLNHEPVLAGPPSATYRLSKFVRRHRVGVAAGAAIVLALVAATVVSTGFALSEAEQRRIAVAAEGQEKHARKEAEQARAAAEEQRKLAEQREKEAIEARDHLQVVADFQSSMLAETDAEGMGLAIVDGFEEGIRAALAGPIEDESEVASVLETWRQQTLKANPTTLALKVLDEFVLAKATETIENEFADQPLVRAALQQTVANTYGEIGLHERALPLLEAALATRRKELGDDHPNTLASINGMGILASALGRLEETEAFYREAVERSRRVLGDDDPRTLTSIGNMGKLLRSMGKYEEARPYYHEALEGRRRVLGDDHPDTLKAIGSMGFLLKSMGKYREAEPYDREALEGHRRVLGDNHRDTLTWVHNMGILLSKMGRHEETEPYYREALEGRRRVLGDNHPRTLVSISEMGALLTKLAKFEEAESYYREALEGRRRVLGNDHPQTLTSVNRIGHLLWSLDKFEEAEPYFREDLEASRRLLGDDHPETLTSIHNMGSLFLSMGNLDKAEPYFREAMETSRRVLGDDHPETLHSIQSMGDLLTQMRERDEAEFYCHEALEGRRRVLGDDHPDTLQSIKNMAYLLSSMDKLDEAEPLFLEAVDGARRSLPPGHWLTGSHLSSYGCCLSKLQRYADAEAALLEAHETFEAVLGAGHRRTINVVASIIGLYDAWDAAEPDMGYDAKAAEWRAKLPASPPGSLPVTDGSQRGPAP